MASFDPSIISQIPDFAGNPVAAKEQGLRLADMQTTQAQNALTLKQNQQAAGEKQRAQEILRGSKLDTPQDVTKAAEKLNNAGLHDEAAQFMKTMQSLQAGKGDLTLQQYQIQAAKADILGGATSSLVGQFDQQIQKGVDPLTATAVMQSRYTEILDQLSKEKLPDGSPALSQQDLALIKQHPQFDPQFLRTIAEKSKQGAAALKVQMEYHKQDTADKAEANREEATKISAKREEDYARGITDKEAEAKVKNEMKKAALLDPEDLLPMAKQYLAGDKSVLQNLGRGDAGAANVANMRRTIRKEAQAEGLSPADVAGRMAQFNGLMAEERSVAARQGAIEIASKEASKVFPIVEKASQALPRNEWVPVNIIVQKWEHYKSDKRLGAFAQAIDSTVNVYARAINATGVPHETAKQRALRLLGTAQDQESFQAVLDIMKAEVEAARTSPDEVRDDILNSFKKSVEPKAGSAAAAAEGNQTQPAATGVTPPPATGTAQKSKYSHLWQ